MVEWSKFLIGLKKIFPDIRDEEVKILQYILGEFISCFCITIYCIYQTTVTQGTSININFPSF
jgi:hypothetical protein